MSRKRKAPPAREAALSHLYSKLPAIECRRRCQQGCGPLAMQEGEWAAIERSLGHEVPPMERMTCPLLAEDGSCSVYPVRPLICRLFGLIPTLACPWGCLPERWLSDEEARKFLRDARRIGGETVYLEPAGRGIELLEIAMGLAKEMERG